MLGDPPERGFGPIASWPLVLLILALVALAMADDDPDIAAIVRRTIGIL